MAMLPMPILFYALLFAQLRQKKKEANMQGHLQQYIHIFFQKRLQPCIHFYELL